VGDGSRIDGSLFIATVDCIGVCNICMRRLFLHMDKENRNSSIRKNSENSSSTHNQNRIFALWEAKWKKRFEYINKNVAVLSLASASIIAIISSLVKFEIYTFYCGMYDYWGVSRSYIVTDQNVLYNLFFNIVLLILLIGVNLISYLILTTQKYSRKQKFMSLSALIIVIFLLIILFAFRFFNISIFDLGIPDIPDIMLIGFYGLILFNFPGIWYAIGKSLDARRKKKDKISCNNKEKRVEKNKNVIYMIILFSLIPLVISIVGSYVYGVYTAGIKNTYWTIERQYVVMCEDNDRYIISECSINDKNLTIYKNRQKVIEKTGIVTEKIRFEDVGIE
jgi:hypothetical protein